MFRNLQRFVPNGIATRASRIAIALALLSCGIVTGLDGYDVVDDTCDGGLCADASIAVVDGSSPQNGDGPSSTVDAGSDASDATHNPDGPPPCDPLTNPTCLQLPSGFELIAIADYAGPAAAPACPTGFGPASDLGTSPSAKAGTCTCSCAVMTTKCEGPIDNEHGGLIGQCNNTSSPGNFRAGQACNQDVPNSPLDNYERFTRAPSGGLCGAPQVTLHEDQVTWAVASRVCDGTDRCASGVCDGTVSTPFTACVANAMDGGAVTCPTSFPKQRVLGSTASFTCGACGACAVTNACVGATIALYKNDLNCMGGASEVVPIDGVCRSITSGQYHSYSVDAGTPTTTCTPTASTASNPMVDATRTICCR